MVPTTYLCSHITASLFHVYQTPDYNNVRKFGLQAAGGTNTSLVKAIFSFFSALMGHLEQNDVI